MRALIVVPALNEAEHLPAVVSTLLQDSAALAGLLLVIADGGSTDGTVAIAQGLASAHPQVRLLHNKARLQSAAVNLAVRSFGRDYDVLVRCDAHARYPHGYCARLIETLQRVEADAVVVPLDSEGHGALQRAIAWVSNSFVGTGGSAHRGGRQSGFVDHGHHAAFRMQMFQRCGGYDESFTHNEDAELDCRQRALGARVYLDSTIRVGYWPRASLGSLWQQYFRYGKGRSRTARRHPGSLRLRQLALPAHLSLSLLALLLSPWHPGLLLWPVAYLCSLVAISLGFAVRHRSPAGLLAGPAAFVIHNAWAVGFLVGLLQLRERVWRTAMVAPLQLGTSAGDGT
ncbi:MAG: hypothetical protein RL033_5379 [Pseudomonadota bacterium]